MIHLMLHNPKYAEPIKDALAVPEVIINLLETILTPEIAKGIN